MGSLMSLAFCGGKVGGGGVNGSGNIPMGSLTGSLKGSLTGFFTRLFTGSLMGSLTGSLVGSLMNLVFWWWEGGRVGVSMDVGTFL